MLSAVASDPERLMMALERTEALDKRTVWHLFEEGQHPGRSLFPRECLPAAGWQSRLLQEQSLREAAFLNGMVKSLTRRDALPDEVLAWMLEELPLCPRDDLANAYVDVLESCPEQMRSLLDLGRIQSLFTQLRAKKELLDIAAEPQPNQKMRKDTSRRQPPRLRWLVDLLGRLASSLSSDVRDYALAVLIRISPDDSIQDNAGLRHVITSTIGALMNSIPISDAESTLERTASQLYTWARDPILQFRTFSCLPAYNPRQCTFRRHLALAFFLGSAKALSIPFTSPDLLDAVLHRLETSSDFVFTHGTDYARVSALFNLLDTAIDAGFSDRSFAEAADQAVARKAEEEFNEGVDDLAGAVRRVMSQIRGSGIESLPKSEAKSVMERLAYRLEAAVRTKEKSGRSVFDSAVMEGEKEALSRWLGIGGAKDPAGL
ncbi:hypothetical protein K490DRAFT_52054 [Saccharata proteae CBS 121410]|uniref:Uncharacterized protein n=1 Tax=Saccharata proteae CBS 121410 TaxID=1314787 RepID=A0A9P4HKL0_9PEZI|nr:hypothetical protein K490DRAFT_52054 [Saccharata proteae CBS 121410]